MSGNNLPNPAMMILQAIANGRPLDYILDALQPGALDESVRAATSNLYRSVEASLLEAENRAPTASRGGGTPWWTAYAKAKGRI